jgi:cell division septation protein DedD
MKKISFLVCVVLSLFTMLGASVWEGAAELSGELPENGLYMATNSFPVNTVVDVTNLENGKIARLIVSARLESSGFLALLSKEAAESLGIHGKTLSRIRMSQNEDPLAFSRLQPEFYTLSSVSAPDYDYSLVPSEERPPEKTAEAELPVTQTPAVQVPVAIVISHPDDEIAIAPEPQEAEALATLVPAEQVPAEKVPVAQVPETPVITPPTQPAPDFSPFMINAFEKGKYYVQIGAYSKAETVTGEISKIDKNLPVALMNAGSEEKPVYRILIGPVNQGESGAILQRFKADYYDAFVWLGR